MQKTPEQQREEFRKGCDLRRNGQKIERRFGEDWVLDTEYASINKAKRAVRNTPHYAL